MPNTLAHIGVQPLLTRPLLPAVAGRWLLLGCVLPDLPWIAQRLARPVLPDAAGHPLRAWCTAQASLAFCLLLAGAVALLARRPAPVFGALAWGSLLHLLLDALQVKWGGGVILLAPLSWRPLSFDLFWPESWPTAIMTLAGVAVAIWLLWRDAAGASGAASGGGGQPGVRAAGRRLSSWRLAAAALLAACWLAGPWLFLERVAAGGVSALDVLAPGTDRRGRAAGFDRMTWEGTAGGLRIYTGESLRLVGDGLPTRAARLSVQGVFRDAATLQVTALHVHPRRWRDAASYLGLALVGWAWIRPAGRRGATA